MRERRSERKREADFWIAPNLRPIDFLNSGESLFDLCFERFWIGFFIRVEMSADFGRKGKSRRNRKSKDGHPMKIGALTAEQDCLIACFALPFGFSTAEGINKLFFAHFAQGLT